MCCGIKCGKNLNISITTFLLPKSTLLYLAVSKFLGLGMY